MGGNKHTQAQVREQYLDNCVDSRIIQNRILSNSDKTITLIISENLILIRKKKKYCRYKCRNFGSLFYNPVKPKHRPYELAYMQS
jgi:hypothetical protein